MSRTDSVPTGPAGAPYEAPDDLPLEVELIAVDLDGTLLASDHMIRERTLAAIASARGRGIRVVIATGRMFRSALPYAQEAGLDDPLICYQGAAVIEPATGEYLRHEPIPLPLARELVAVIQELGHTLNAYVDDELYVAEITEEAKRYATFQHLPIHGVGDLLAWIAAPPTKLVSVGEGEAMNALRLVLEPAFAERLHISKSLPMFLEFSRKGVTKGSGLAFLCERLGVARERVVAFGDAENDVELLEWAGYGIAVANADERVRELADHVCPAADEEGVAQVIEAILARA